MLAESVSQCFIRFLILSVMAHSKEDVLWRDDIVFKKDTEKVVLLQAEKRVNTNYRQVQG